MPVIFYDIHSKGAESYIQLAKEVIANAQKRVGQGIERADTGAGGGHPAAAAAAAAGAGGSDASSSGGGNGDSGGNSDGPGTGIPPE